MLKEKSKETNIEKKKKIQKLDQKEFEEKVLALAKEGVTSEKIGDTLKREGVHSKDYDKTISQILKENNLHSNPDLQNVQNKLNKISVHFEKNKQDKRALREKSRVFSQLRKLKKYHKVL